MKRILLSLVLASFFFAATAQDCTTIGFADQRTGFFQNFESTTDFSVGDGAGIYPWGDTIPQGAPSTAPENYFYAPVKVEGGMLKYTVTQNSGRFEPVGISFGDKEDGGKFVIDLSDPANKAFEIKVTNNSTSPILFRVALQDSTGLILDTKASAEGAAHYEHVQEIAIEAGATETFTGTFEGAFYTEWESEYDPIAQPSGCPSNTSTLINKDEFNFSAVSNVTFTIIHREQDPASTTCYYYKTLTDAEVAIDYIKFGSVCPFGTGTGTKKPTLANAIGMVISPNPATEIASINYKANSNAVVNVTDLNGTLVKSVSGSSTSAEIDVADLRPGIYMVSVMVDGVPSAAQKLVVR